MDAGLRGRRSAIVQAHIDGENRHDPDAILATFAGEPRYDVPMLGSGADVIGADAVREMWEGLLSGFPELHLEAGPFHHADAGVFVEVRMTGTNSGDWHGMPSTGRAVDVRMGCWFEFDGDRLVCEHLYMDFATILAQLELPLGAD